MRLSKFPFRKKPIANRFFSWLNTSTVFGLLLGISLFNSVGVAADTLESKTTLTLDRAVERTLGQHPQLGIFVHRRQGYLGLIDEVGVGARPNISFSVEDFSGGESHSGFDNAQATLSISWVMQQAIIEGRVRAAEVLSSQVEFQKEITALDLSAQTARLFIKVLVQERRLFLVKKAANQARDTVEELNKRANAGKSSELERLQAEVELARRELDEEDLKHELMATHYQLGAQWGGGREIYSVEGDLYKLPRIANIEQQFELLKKAPALALLATQQRIAESEIELSRIEAKPQWQFSVGVRRYQATDDFGFVAGVSVPLGSDVSSTGKIRSLRAKKAEYESDSLVLKRKLETQIYVLLQEIKHSQHVIDALKNRIIPTLDSAELHATKSFDSGQLTYQQWNTIVQRNLDAQHSLLSAFEVFHLQNIELQRLTGSSLTL